MRGTHQAIVPLKFFLLIFFLSASLFAQVKPGLEEISTKLNKELPEIYDHATKLMGTTVSNGHLVYHFLVNITQEEYDAFSPKVKAQMLKSSCSDKTKRMLLNEYKANLVFRYVNTKGQSLGEFMIRADHCKFSR